MYEDEEQLRESLTGLKIDDAPRPEHRRELRQKVLAAFERASEKPTRAGVFAPRFEQWRQIMRTRIARVAAAGVFVLGVAALIAVFTVTGRGGVALADVLAGLEQARTVCFKMTWHSPGTDPLISQVMVLTPGLMRSESAEMINIIDWNEGEILGLYPKDKMAFRGKIEEMGNPYDSNWLEDLKRIIGSEASEELQQRELDGRTVKGWRIRDEDDWLVTVWADANTAELVRVDGRKDEFVMAMTDFEFDRPLDEGLFSLEPPEGYTTGPRTVMKLSELGAEDVAVLLNIWARGNGMKFPGNLNPWEFSQAANKVRWDQIEGNPSEINNRISKAFGFLFGKPGWSYGGKGVKLGDGEAPVFWYKPEGSDKYRVIYGDLRIEDVAEEPAPSKQ